jgi:hypothetical protein
LFPLHSPAQLVPHRFAMWSESRPLAWDPAVLPQQQQQQHKENQQQKKRALNWTPCVPPLPAASAPAIAPASVASAPAVDSAASAAAADSEAAAPPRQRPAVLLCVLSLCCSCGCACEVRRRWGSSVAEWACAWRAAATRGLCHASGKQLSEGKGQQERQPGRPVSCGSPHCTGYSLPPPASPTAPAAPAALSVEVEAEARCVLAACWNDVGATVGGAGPPLGSTCQLAFQQGQSRVFKSTRFNAAQVGGRGRGCMFVETCCRVCFCRVLD